MERCDVDGCEAEADKISRTFPRRLPRRYGVTRHILSERPTKDFDIVHITIMN